MSYRERRNRKDAQGKTPGQLHHNRCAICEQPIRRGQETVPVPRGFQQAHMACAVRTVQR
jgi:hypothetical protein